MIQLITAGLILGIAGSFHCVGMCGPLALSLPVQHLNKNLQFFSVFLYNTGRLITYSILGLLFGLAGRKIYLAGWQQWVSILLGITILLLAVEYFILKNPLQPKWMHGFHLFVQNTMSRFLKMKNLSGYFLLGTANGLLPCGMVYMAIAGALVYSQVHESVVFMMSFGAGTLPAMMLLSLAGMRASFSMRKNIKKIIPVVVMVVGALLILRGMNLGIPFLSPMMDHAPQATISCNN